MSGAPLWNRYSGPVPWYAPVMAKKNPARPFETKPAGEVEALRHYAFMESVIFTRRAEGFQIDELESALGMYMLARHFGWKVLYLVHSRKTIKKYEEILGIKLSDHFDPLGPDADRTNAKKVIDAVTNFWRLVSGEEKPPEGIDKRALDDR